MTEMVWNSLHVDQAWPEHAGHDVRYTEIGRKDYPLVSVVVASDGIWEPEEWDLLDPVQADIESTEVWCADCGVPLYEVTNRGEVTK